MASERHQFAVYEAGLSDLKVISQRLKILGFDLIHRITKVLRLEVGEQLVLFDAQKSMVCQVLEIGRKEVVLSVQSEKRHAPLQHRVIMAVGVLKKDHFEDALYSCVELGATEIWPILFQKSQGWNFNAQRLQQILISAAEQSKNFSIPVCQAPITGAEFFQKLATDNQSTYVACDVAGEPFLDVLQTLQSKHPAQVVLIVGPEGDLTASEKAALQAAQVRLMRLTPTVLRSIQAVAVGLGAIRSVLK